MAVAEGIRIQSVEHEAFPMAPQSPKDPLDEMVEVVKVPSSGATSRASTYALLTRPRQAGGAVADCGGVNEVVAFSPSRGARSVGSVEESVPSGPWLSPRGDCWSRPPSDPPAAEDAEVTTPVEGWTCGEGLREDAEAAWSQSVASDHFQVMRYSDKGRGLSISERLQRLDLPADWEDDEAEVQRRLHGMPEWQTYEDTAAKPCAQSAVVVEAVEDFVLDVDGEED